MSLDELPVKMAASSVLLRAVCSVLCNYVISYMCIYIYIYIYMEF